MSKLFCCYLNKNKSSCLRPVRVEIWGDHDRYDYTHSCSRHIYSLLQDGENRIYYIVVNK